MGGWRAGVGLVLVVASGGLRGGATTESTGSFGSPMVLARLGGAQQVATDEAGNAVAVWSDNGSTVRAALARARSKFGTPVELSRPSRAAHNPQVAEGSDGNMVAVWDTCPAKFTCVPGSRGRHRFVVQAALRTRGHGFAPPVDLSEAADLDATIPAVAMDPRGDAVAAWSRFDANNGTGGVVQAAMRSVGGAFGRRVDVSAPGQGGIDPQVAMDPAGDAIVAWTGFTGRLFNVDVAVRPARGGFQSSVTLSADSLSGPIGTAMDAAGNAVVVWADGDGVKAALRPAEGAFGQPVRLGAGQDPAVAMDPAGDVVVVFSSGGDVRAVARKARSAFGAPVQLTSPVRFTSAPRVAMDRAGDAVVVWTRPNGTNFSVQAVRLQAGHQLAAPADLSAAGQDANDARIAMDDAGDAIAVWQWGTRVQAARSSPQMNPLRSSTHH